MGMRFDVPRLIQRFGGRMQLYRCLHERGHDISIKAVEKWRERGRIPDRWLAELLEIAREQRKPLDLSKYLIDPDAPADAVDVLG